MNNRNIGLDILRVLAAGLVIICHSSFFSVGIPFPLLGWAGVIAVEIFFVLSGFLVGKSLIRTVTSKTPGPEMAKFYVNRILRTLPLYYLVLLATGFLSGKAVPVSCFLFIQNFWEEAVGFLPQSWSLTIEAWFYFLIPPMMLVLVKALGNRGQEKAVALAIGILWAVPFLCRMVYVLGFDQSWDLGIRKCTPLRLDAVMVGVALAAWKLYAPESYRRTAKHHSLLFVSLAGIVGSYLLYKGYLMDDAVFDASKLWKILAFTVLPMLCAMLMMYMENSELVAALGRLQIASVIPWLGTLSYGVYLLQLMVFGLVSPWFADKGFAMSWLGFLGAIVLTVAAAQIVYWLVEVPCTKLRDRIYARAETK